MYNPQTLPAYVIVDMEPLILFYMRKYPTVTPIFQYLPITEMIRLMLTIGMEALENAEMITNELDDRVPDHIEIDIINLDFFITELANSVDTYIGDKFPPYLTTGAYLFSRWMTSTSLMLYSIIHQP